MTDSFEDVFAQDLQACVPPLQRWTWGHSFRFPVANWIRRLRKLEALDRERSKLSAWRLGIYYVLRWQHLRDSARLGFSIPRHCFGPGLSIAHWGTISVDTKARIGASCRVHQGVTIGSSKGQSPVIGDNCFIGANAVVIGGIELGDNVTIGANALVNRSFPDGAILVGVPAENVAEVL